jgi:hypothetical protein
MRGRPSGLERLGRRIADVRYCIEQARGQHMPERERMLVLLKATLKALEVRKEALIGANQDAFCALSSPFVFRGRAHALRPNSRKAIEGGHTACGTYTQREI